MISAILTLAATALAPVTLPTPPAPVEQCRYIDRWRGTNVPISPGIPATDIVHAIAVSAGRETLGWLVFRRDGRAWYFDGPVRQQAPPPKAKVLIALNALGLERYATGDVGVGAMIPMKKPIEVSRLVSGGLGVYTCF